MSFLSNVIKTIAPVVATVAPLTGPTGMVIGAVAGEKAKSDARKVQREQAEIAARSRRQNMQQEFYGIGNVNTSGQSTQGSGSGGGFGSQFGTFLSDVGTNIATPFINLATTLSPLFGGSVAQQPAVTTTRGAGAQETQGSGTITAGAGSLIGQALTGAGRFLTTPTGQITTGLGAGLLGSMLGGQSTGMRVTRKMKSQARMVLNLTGGNISAAADILGISQEMLIQVLLKRFRNDGPVVTKAALRKTKQTIRRLHSMQDVLKSITPTAAGRRRAPMRRATTTTLIKN